LGWAKAYPYGDIGRFGMGDAAMITGVIIELEAPIKWWMTEKYRVSFATLAGMGTFAG
jgi:hypothetical protein